MFISLDVIATLVANLKEDLTRDALRTIRNKRPDEGVSILGQIEGVELLQRSIDRAAQSPSWIDSGHVISAPPTPPAEKKRKRGLIPEPVPAVRHRVRTLKVVGGGK